MNHRFFRSLLLVMILMTLAVPRAAANQDSQLLGVWVFNNDEFRSLSASINNSVMINYGAFQWIVLHPSDFAPLDSRNLSYQVVENPYHLSLGGLDFDPLYFKPNLSSDWYGARTATGASLHLVQFYGPTKDAWLDDLRADGLTIIQYIHPFTYLVWGEAESIPRAAERSPVRWTGDFLPGYAVLPNNRIQGDDAKPYRAMVVRQAGLEQSLKALETLGASHLSGTKRNDPAFDLINFSLSGNQLHAAASLPGVVTIQPIPSEGGDRSEMSNQVNVGNVDAFDRAFPGYLAWLNQLGLSGQGVVIANVDSGIDENHPDLINRMLPCIGSTCGGSTIASNHGTHTAGIMVGDGASGVRDLSGFLRGLGMAPGANLIEQVYSPTYQLENGMLTLMSESYRNGAVISGNSWGPSDDPLGYDMDTRLVDIGVRDADPEIPNNQNLTYVLSIMNGYGGTSTQGTPDEAKNIFTIGSTFMQNGNGSQSININDLSYNTAHGPALDGRTIPHLVAPGCYVDSTYTSASYGLMCGTSMASPHVSGAAALFFEQYRYRFGKDPSPALVKAAFLPVAHDLAGYHDADGLPMGHPFDSKQGWGRLDADAVLDPTMSVFYYDQQTILSGTGDSWTTTLTTNEPIDELRAMLVWTDAPGPALGGSTPAWINDLDLSISIGGQTYYGNAFGGDGYSISGGSPDRMNNTEGIFLRNLSKEFVTLTVTAANIAGDGVPNLGDETDQDFALVVYTSKYDNVYQYIFPLFFH